MSGPDKELAMFLDGLLRMWNRSAKPLSPLDVAILQKQALKEILLQDQGTPFGKEHGFDTIRTRADYHAKVPVTTHGEAPAPEAFLLGVFPNRDGHPCGLVNIRTCYYEFRCLENRCLFPTHQLQVGTSYDLILTAPGGPYRLELPYAMRILKNTNSVPLVELLHDPQEKQPAVLDEGFVRGVLTECGVTSGFALMAPEGNRYVLYAQGDGLPSPARLDKLLREHPEYAKCRSSGRLGPAQIYRVEGRPQVAYVQYYSDKGQTLGEIRQTLLADSGGWMNYFEGGFLPRVPKLET